MVQPDPGSPAAKARELYEQLLGCWNAVDANGFAALFTEDGEAVGFDGSQMAGREEMAATLRHLFLAHPPAAYIGIVRSVRVVAPDVAILRAEAGMVPLGGSDIDPALSAVQLLAAVATPAGWRIAAFQNTPAQFHGRPEAVEALNAELRRELQAPSA